MPTIRRSRTIAATPEDLWAVVGDPYHLPRWWPRVDRVEAVAGGKFTELLRAKSGRNVRADFRIDKKERDRLLAFDQQIDGTPFERVLQQSRTEIALEPAGEGATRVTITLKQKMRGAGRLGGLLVRRAGRRVLDTALEGLEDISAAS